MAEGRLDEWSEDGEEYGEEGADSLRYGKEKLIYPGTTELVSVAAFKAECAEGLHFEELHQPVSERISSEVFAQKMGISVEKMDDIRAQCNPNNLFGVGMLDSESSPLQCIRKPRQIISLLERNLFSSISYSNVYHERINTDESLSVQPSVSFDEVLLTVDIFHPKKQRNDHSFLVLASQKLTDLRDKIICPNDYFCFENLSETPTALRLEQDSPAIPNISKSAFFFISNTFYNDMRHPESTDLSKPIISWTEEGTRLAVSPELDRFDAVSMEGVTFEQLKIKLGFPYIYCHHSNCEHLLIFRDMRLFNIKGDPSFLQDYPRLTFCTKIKKRLCQSCDREAVCLTCNDELAQESPCFFCYDCFLKLHYTTDEKKVCSFKAYKYREPNYPTVPHL